MNNEGETPKMVTVSDMLDDLVAFGSQAPYSRVMTITPEIAKYFLDKNPDNRPLGGKVKAIAEDIKNGRWAFNGESIIISDDGFLNDGQHRLAAIVDADIPVSSLVVFGVPRASRTTVDQGSVRNAGNYLAMEGMKNTSALSFIARYAIAYEKGDGTSFADMGKISNTAILDRARNDPDMIASASFATSRCSCLKGLCSPSALGFCHYIFGKVDKVKAEEFMRQVVTGENIGKGDPAFAVRNAYIAINDRSVISRIEVTMRGWAAFHRGEQLIQAKRRGILPAIGLER